MATGLAYASISPTDLNYPPTQTMSDATWSAWNSGFTTTQITTSATTDSTWVYWNQSALGLGGTTTTMVTFDQGTANTTWQYWNSTFVQVGQIEPSRIVTPEQDRQWRLLDLKRRRAEKLMRRRAAALLREHLTDQQRADLAAKGEFVVESGSGKLYAIKKGRAGNVYSLDERRRKVTQLCIHPDDLVPDEDTMLAQLLWIKWNEEEFLRVANKTRLREAA